MIKKTALVPYGMAASVRVQRIATILGLVGASVTVGAAAGTGGSGRGVASFDSLPLVFEPAGRAAPERFFVRGARYRALLGATEAVVVLPGRASSGIGLRFHGAGSGATIRGEALRPGKSNYFLGRDPSGWRIGVPHFSRVVVDELYEGIDLVYYGRGREMELDFLVAPGVDPSHIQIEIERGDALRIDEVGDVVVDASEGEFRLRAPYVYQEVDGGRRTVEGSYRVVESGAHRWRVGFELGPFDTTRPLVVDPLLGYIHRAGGSNLEEAMDVAADALGNAYITGWTRPVDFRSPNGSTPGLIGAGGDADVFVIKLAPNGTVLFSTFIGGTSFDQGLGIGVDEAGNVYVGGKTAFFDSGFPSTPGALRTTAADFFVSKLDPTGSSLLYSTFFGGSNIGSFGGLDVGPCGTTTCVYIAGTTVPGHPTTLDAYRQSPSGSSDAFLAVLDPSQLDRSDQIVYSTVFGGSSGDTGLDVAAGPGGRAYITGNASSGLPLRHAFDDTAAGNREAFLAVFDPRASGDASLLYATYVGGSGSENDTAEDGGVAVDADGVALLTGSTTSFDFPVTPEGIRVSRQSSDGYFLAVDPSLPGRDSLRYGTFVGGSFADAGTDVAAGPPGTAYVGGYTQSNDLPNGRGGVAEKLGDGAPGAGNDGFVMKIDWTHVGDASLVDAAYVGGTGPDFGYGVATDGYGHAYLAGRTDSSDGFEPSPGFGFTDAFMAGLGTILDLPAGTLGTPSSDTLTTNFGTAPHTFSLLSGQPPAGLSLEAGGILSGEPTELGTAVFSVEVRDSLGAVREQTYRKRIGTGAGPADIRLRKGGSTTVPGRVVEYYILVRNVTGQTLTNVMLFERIEPWFRFLSAVPPPDRLDQSFMLVSDFPQLAENLTLDRFAYWTIPQMAPGELKVISYEVLLTPNAQLGATVTGEVCQDDPECSDDATKCLDDRYRACEAICGAENWFDFPTDPGEILWDFATGLFSEDKCKACFDLATEQCKGAYLTCLNVANFGEECMELSPAEGTTAEGCCDGVASPAVAPKDPNEKVVGSPSFIPPGEVLGYSVHFENLGTVEAKDVFVEDVLDEDADIETVQVLRPNGGLMPLPVNATVSIFDDDEEEWEVTLDGASRTLRWSLANIDLPVGGTDSLFYVVTAPEHLPSGAEIRNSADIQFEVFDVFTTNETVNVVDSTAPSCTVDPLPETTFERDFTVSWTGSDPLGELARFFVYVSSDGGPFEKLTPELETSMTFTGEIGKSYGFFCIAQDTAGNSEPLERVAEAITRVEEEQEEPPPAPVSDLSARAKSGQVSLFWTPVPGAVAYDVYRSSTPGGPGTAIALGHVTSYATYLDTGLSNGETYYYVVASVGPSGATSEISNEASATPTERVRRRR